MEHAALNDLKAENQEAAPPPVAPGVDPGMPAEQYLTDDAKSSMTIVDLPSGYIDHEGKLYKTASVREITGEEEDLLTAKNVPVFQRMQKLLENCITSIGPYNQGTGDWSNIIRRLTVTDRLFLVLKTRIVTLGPIYTFKVQCPECSKYSNHNVDLNEFVVTGLPDPMKRNWEGKLKKSGKGYVARIQTGAEEEALGRIKDTKDTLSLAIIAKLVSLDGKTPVTLAMVKSLPMMDREQLRSDFMEHEGSIDNSADVTCPHCSAEFKTEVDIGQPSFFFPSAISKR